MLGAGRETTRDATTAAGSSFVCATAVVGLFFGVSYAYGEGIAEWLRHSEQVLTFVLVGIVVVVALVLYLRRRKRIARMQAIQKKRSERAAARNNPTLV